jgi:hypothetical protein
MDGSARESYDGAGEPPGVYLSTVDLYGSSVRLKVSTLASQSAVWLQVENESVAGLPPLPAPVAAKMASALSSAHLGIDHACELIAGLTRWMLDGNLPAMPSPYSDTARCALEHIGRNAAAVRDAVKAGQESVRDGRDQDGV